MREALIGQVRPEVGRPVIRIDVGLTSSDVSGAPYQWVVGILLPFNPAGVTAEETDLKSGGTSGLCVKHRNPSGLNPCLPTPDKHLTCLPPQRPTLVSSHEP